jgi:glycosyltransferase involved in cell wall biosynthesis
MPGVSAAADWNDLKARLRVSRFFVHTAETTMEDGYNMATVEAMATGLPILSNDHPTSPIEHGKSGYVSDDPKELRSYAEALLRVRELALRLGENARKRAAEVFSMDAFQSGFLRALARAKAKYSGMLIAPKKRKRNR